MVYVVQTKPTMLPEQSSQSYRLGMNCRPRPSGLNIHIGFNNGGLGHLQQELYRYAIEWIPIVSERFPTGTVSHVLRTPDPLSVEGVSESKNNTPTLSQRKIPLALGGGTSLSLSHMLTAVLIVFHNF